MCVYVVCLCVMCVCVCGVYSVCVVCGGGGVGVCGVGVGSVWGVCMRYLDVYTPVQALVEAQGQPWVYSTFFEARSPTEPEVHSFSHAGWSASELPECTSPHPTNAA